MEMRSNKSWIKQIAFLVIIVLFLSLIFYTRGQRLTVDKDIYISLEFNNEIIELSQEDETRLKRILSDIYIKRT